MTGLTVLIISAAIPLYLYCRRRHVIKLHNKLSRPIMVNEVDSGTPLYLVGAVGAVSAYDAIYNLAMIDERVLEALDFSTVVGTDNFAALQAHVREHFLSGAPASIEGALNRLEGYTAEHIVAADLAAQGHVVEFPDTPNQEGWDLLVDGEPFQVKNSMDPGAIRDHLDKYPDIPVIANAEMGLHFQGHDQVLIDPELSNADVADNVQRTVHGVADIGGVDFSIPAVTLALSALREGKLLFNNRIDLVTAAGRVGADVVGVGGGGLAGSALGGAVGSIAGPLGVAAGSVIGAVLGATLGRMVANVFRMRHYHAAVERFNLALIDVCRNLGEAIRAKMDALTRKESSILDRIKSKRYRAIFWPGPAELIAVYVKDKIAVQQRELQELCSRIPCLDSSPVPKDKIMSECLFAYQEARTGRYHHRGLLRALEKAKRAYRKVIKERKRLGY